MTKISNRIILFLACIGLVISMYLSYSEIIGIAPECSVISGCETVQESEYSHILGVPVAFLGVLFYISLVFASFLRLNIKFEKLLTKLLFLATLIGVLFSAYLTYIELYVIFAICIYCVLSAVVSVLLFFVSLYENMKKSQVGTQEV